MARRPAPIRLERRPLYTVARDAAGGWRVTARRGRRGRGGFLTKAAAVAHAERLAAGHLVAQIRVYGAEGRLERDEMVRNEARCRQAEEWLEAYLEPWRDYQQARSRLVEDWHVENRLVEIAGEVVWLFVGVHEGQAWDEIYVHSSLGDESLGPNIAEVAFVLFGW